MLEGLIGSLVGAGAKIIPSLFGDTKDNAAEARFDAQQRMQMAMATRGLTWRAEDAIEGYKRTGIHPLSILGVQGPTYSPVGFVGGDRPAWKEAVGSAGQDVGRAISATAGSNERAQLAALQLERARLENDLLRTKIASENQVLNQPGNPPPMPIGRRYLMDGQGDSTNTELRSPVARGPLVVDQPLKRTVSDPGAPSNEPGAVALIRWARTPTGWMPIKSKDTQEGLEDDMLGNFAFNVANRLMPMIHSQMRIPLKNVPFPAPDGKMWFYDPLYQEYRLVPVRTRDSGAGIVKIPK